MRFPVLCTLLISTLILSLSPSAPAAQEIPVKALAVHAHRYQDFRRGLIVCEVFGEIKNTGDRPIKNFTLHLEMLDRKGKVVGNEELLLELRVIAPGRARGDLRAVKPQEIGNFIADTKNCPDSWLEGRIRYRVLSVQTE